jgi:hypothetical protein
MSQASQKCRWCGSNTNAEFSTCPNCHRIQHPILGKLQVFNAPSWLAVAVAGVALLFSYQQNALVGIQVEEARKERALAEEAVVGAEKVLQEASKLESRVIEEADRIEDLMLAGLRGRLIATDSLISVGCSQADAQEFLKRCTEALNNSVPEIMAIAFEISDQGRLGIDVNDAREMLCETVEKVNDVGRKYGGGRELDGIC